jgi:membrane protease YdiL (CAAX protease family)
VGFAIFLEYKPRITVNTILINVIAASFFEELYYRGFLFGQLFRYTSLGFILSVILGAVIFGLIHLYQGSALTEWIGIFLITFLGGILFAWVYVEWNFNLWVPVLLHLLMNLSFEMFSAGENALGGIYLNIFRSITLFLIIFLTIIYKRKSGIKKHGG